MKIDDTQIKHILNNDSEASSHWIFSNIVEGKYLYEGIRIPKNRISSIKTEVFNELLNFHPLNEDIFNLLFPNWNDIGQNTQVELVVGCPQVYDMMVRNDVIVIDIQNIDKYLEAGHNLKELLQILITHEFIHMCINQDFQLASNACYLDKLDYLLFQEGFAHAIPYMNNLNPYEYSLEFNASRKTLEDAIIELNKTRQEEFLMRADTGEYWNKFGAISSKLFILHNKDKILEVYKNGYTNFHQKILNYQIK